MTTIQPPPNKEITVKQYEFYKRKGLSDDKIMKMHGYHTVGFNTWKKENKLIGVKFDSDLKVSKGAVVTTKPSEASSPVEEKPLREKEVSKNSLLQTIEEYEANKRISKKLEEKKSVAPIVEVAPINPVPVAANHSESDEINGSDDIDKQIPSEPTETPVHAPVDDSEHPTIDAEDYNDQLNWFSERHCKDTETIHQLELQLQAEKERGNNFCDRMLAAERLHREENAKVLNLQSEVKKQDEALIRYAKLEDYLFQTMQVAQDQRDRRLMEDNS